MSRTEMVETKTAITPTPAEMRAAAGISFRFGLGLDNIQPIAAMIHEECGQEWKCFHCEFSTSDRKEAAAHFGHYEEEVPLCLTWTALNADGKAHAYQSIIRELEGEREHRLKLQQENEGLEHQLGEYENLLGSRFKGCRTINDAFNLYDSMEGRVLAAEATIAELRTIFEAHTKAVGEFLTELHAITIDPCAEGTIKLQELMPALLEAARRDRQTEYDAASAVAELREALAGVMSLISDGWLVRNTASDMEPGWAMRQISPTQKLAVAEAILAQTAPKEQK